MNYGTLEAEAFSSLGKKEKKEVDALIGTLTIASLLDQKVKKTYPDKDPKDVSFTDFVEAVQGKAAADKIRKEFDEGMTYAEMRSRYG